MVDRKEMKDTWAIFNLEIDPDTFEFDVALGARITSDAPGSPWIGIHPRDKRVTCSIFIQNDKPRGRRRDTGLLRKKLEILLPHNWEEATFECQRQLSLALRLFKPFPFWISPWERRSEVGVVSPPVTLYDIRGETELRRFCKFSKILFYFQENRNVYEFLRSYSSIYPEGIPEFLGESDASGHNFLSTFTHLAIATQFLEQACRDWRLSPELRLILLMVAAEALFTDEDKGELSYRLSHRMAALNGGNPDQRKQIFELTRKLYEVRSRVMHGSMYRKRHGFLEVPLADLSEFINLVRASLLYLIAQNERGKREVLDILDRAIFDEKEVVILRLQANKFWGFGESPKEYLHSNKWT